MGPPAPGMPPPAGWYPPPLHPGYGVPPFYPHPGYPPPPGHHLFPPPGHFMHGCAASSRPPPPPQPGAPFHGQAHPLPQPSSAPQQPGTMIQSDEKPLAITDGGEERRRRHRRRRRSSGGGATDDRSRSRSPAALPAEFLELASVISNSRRLP